MHILISLYSNKRFSLSKKQTFLSIRQTLFHSISFLHLVSITSTLTRTLNIFIVSSFIIYCKLLLSLLWTSYIYISLSMFRNLLSKRFLCFGFIYFFEQQPIYSFICMDETKYNLVLNPLLGFCLLKINGAVIDS
jgi:hypothetical protein